MRGVHPRFIPKGFEVMLWIHLATSTTQHKILIATDLLNLILIGDVVILLQSLVPYKQYTTSKYTCDPETQKREKLSSAHAGCT